MSWCILSQSAYDMGNKSTDDNTVETLLILYATDVCLVVTVTLGLFSARSLHSHMNEYARENRGPKKPI